MPVFDCEADSLYPDKFHVLSYETGKSVESVTDSDGMVDWLEDQEELVGHNIYLWDLVQLERVLGAKPRARIVDTLALSWYLYPNRVKHGLESWGEEFGVP